MSGSATVSGNSVTLTGAGTVTLRAAQAGSGNYVAAPDVDVTFAVAKALASVTFAGLAQTYDGAPKPISATTIPAGLGVTYSYNGASSPPVNAGSYAVGATINDPNYTGTGSGTLVVAKAPGAIAFGNLNLAYDGTPKFVSATTTPAGLALSLNYNGSASAPVNAGSYGVAAVITDTNYTGSASDTLVVGKTSAGIVLGGLNPTYDGSPKAIAVSTTPARLAVSVTYAGGTTPPTNAGSYAVAVTVIDANYTGSAPGTLVIGQATASIALGNLNQAYNGSPRPVSTNTTPAGLVVGVTYGGSTVVPTNAGSYVISATITDANYAGSTTGTLSILQGRRDGDADRSGPDLQWHSPPGHGRHRARCARLQCDLQRQRDGPDQLWILCGGRDGERY